MGIFDRFPYSSTHEMNLDFMLGKATEIAESLQEIDTHKEQAEQAAQAAQAAQTAAQAAQTAAQAAQTAAQTSTGQAAQHKADAEDAADRAEAASNLADEAVEQAQTAATTAGTAAQNASTAADGAIASATAAETRINTLAASLPEDFTALNDEVNNLNTYANTGFFPYNVPMERGWIGTNGLNSESTYALRTVDYIPVNNNTIQIFLKTGTYFATVKLYDANHQIIANLYSNGNIPPDTDYTVPATAKYMRFAIDSTNHTQDPVTSTSGGVRVKIDNLKWKNKKWVCIGDSLTEANSRTTKHYYDYILGKTGITAIINAGSGSGYKNPSSVDNKTFYDRAAEIPIDADVVTVFGSGNDLTHGYTLGNVTDTGTDTICGCINTTIDALISRIPTIQLGIIAPTPWVNFPPNIAGNPMELYVQALHTICKNRSIPFLDLYHCSNLRPWTAEGRTACYSKDEGNGVHPDETGHKIIAPRFEGFLDTLLLS